MKSFRFFFTIAILLGVVIVACGDKVTVPPDKTGKCVAGLLTKCGDTCVDLQTDIANCGACMAACTGAKVCVQGKCMDSCPPGSTRCTDKCVNTDTDRTDCGMCGKACAANEVCAKGKCAPTCEAAGYTTCAGMSGGFDAGGATECVDVTSDSNNCGGCGIKCMTGMSCSGGACCPAGQVGCNGQCFNLQADSNHCGTCNTVCGMAAPNCVAAQCSKCKPDVLILSDSQTAINQNLTAAFTKAGLRPTTIDKGSTQYAGMPAATDFSAIFIIPGADFNTVDMPMNGQQAITTAQSMGKGVVFDGFAHYMVSQLGHYQTLKQIMLFSYPLNGGLFNAAGISVTQQDPFFTGIAGFNYTTVNAMQWFNVSFINNASQVATQTTNNIPAEASRAQPNGRIVHFNACANYSSAANAWTNDPNTTQWFIDGVRWAAGCAP